MNLSCPYRVQYLSWDPAIVLARPYFVSRALAGNKDSHNEGSISEMDTEIHNKPAKNGISLFSVSAKPVRHIIFLFEVFQQCQLLIYVMLLGLDIET